MKSRQHVADPRDRHCMAPKRYCDNKQTGLRQKVLQETKAMQGACKAAEDACSREEAAHTSLEQQRDRCTHLSCGSPF